MGLRTTTDQRYFVYDGDQMVLVMDPAGAVQNRYLWGAAVDEILADEQVGGEVLWTLTDNLGTVRELVNNTSTVRNHIVYDTYGNVLSETAGGARSAIKFTGRYLDTETGLQWNLNRWYDAKTGRWLSQDPIGFEGGDANLYRYVGNDPGNGVDPSGLEKTAGQPRLQPGEVAPPQFQPGGPSDLPAMLRGRWRVWVCAGGGHAWQGDRTLTYVPTRTCSR